MGDLAGGARELGKLEWRGNQVHTVVHRNTGWMMVRCPEGRSYEGEQDCIAVSFPITAINRCLDYIKPAAIGYFGCIVVQQDTSELKLNSNQQLQP